MRPGAHTEDFNEQMDGLEVCELIVIGVDADAEEQTGITSVDDLVIPELHVQ